MGGTENRLVLTLLRGELENKPVVQVAVGIVHTIFVTSDDLVFACWLNRNGQLGVGDTKDRLVPTLVTGQLQGKTAVHVSAGDYHTLYITATGSLFAWGWNGYGQLGVGDTKERRVPSLVTALQGKQVVHVAAGFIGNLMQELDINVTISAITSNTIWTFRYLIYITFTSHTSHPTS